MTLTRPQAARTSNFGSAPTLLVQGPGPTAAQAYMRFDLTTLPSGTRGADVARAVLRLWVDEGDAARDARRPFRARRLERGRAHGRQRPGRGRDELVGHSGLGAGSGTAFVLVDVTEIVQEWLDRTLENNGLVLMPNAAGVSVEFDSKENAATSHEPQLEITLRATGAAGPPGPPGPAGAEGARGPSASAGQPARLGSGPVARRVRPGPSGPAGVAGSRRSGRACGAAGVARVDGGRPDRERGDGAAAGRVRDRRAA